jgi:hypothetical protein
LYEMMKPRNTLSLAAAALTLGLCATLLGACDVDSGSQLTAGATDDFIDMDTPPLVTSVERFRCSWSSACFRLTFDDGTECELGREDVEEASDDELFQICRE